VSNRIFWSRGSSRSGEAHEGGTGRMSDSRNLWMFRMGSTIIGVHTKVAPSDAEWKEYIQLCKKVADDAGFPALRGLSITDGGAPTSTQRALANEFLEGRSAPTAILSSSSIVRGVVTAMSWFNPKIKSFAPVRAREALAYIDFPTNQIGSLCARLRDMKSSVGVVGAVLKELDWPGVESRSGT
jgi:hypothetical protein